MRDKERMNCIFFFVICTKLPKVKLAGVEIVFFCYINVENTGKKTWTYMSHRTFQG